MPRVRRRRGASCRSGQAPNPSDWLGGLAVHIANIGVHFEIVEPPELVEVVRELAERFAGAGG